MTAPWSSLRTPLSITIDTREQTPWAFPPEAAAVRRGTLRTGDYAVTGDPLYAVERKTLSDFLGTISSGWARFTREILRARHSCYALPILVEADLEDCLFRLPAAMEGALIRAALAERPRATDAEKLARVREILAGGGRGGAVEPPAHDHPLLSPPFILRRIAEIERAGGHVMFCGRAAPAVCLALLRERRREMDEEPPPGSPSD